MSNLAERMANLSPERRALFQKLLQESQVVVPETALKPHSRDGGPLPLSYAQERLWFMQQLEPQSAAYNVPAAYRLEGDLDTTALQKAFNALLQRHEVLRTSFVAEAGQPWQQIVDKAFLDLPVIDFSHYADEAQKHQLQQALAAEASRPFDLATDLPIRAHIWRLQPRKHLLVVTMHHIAADTWSSRVAARDIQQFYHAYQYGEPARLPPLPIQYGDYALWQRQWLQGNELNRHLTFWQESLRGVPHKLELPTDYPRPATLSDKGARHSFTLSPAVSRGLKELSQQQGTTLFTTMLAAFQILLYRYSHQESFVIGSPIANRGQPETANLIGFFANTLALRADLKPDLSFLDVLAQARRTCLSAFEHEALPLSRLIEAIQPERCLNCHPLFQVTFALQSASFGSLSLPDLTITSMPIEHNTTKFDLTLSLFDEQTHLTGYFEYSQELFTAVTIQQMAANWQTLLAHIIGDPQRPISSLPLLAEETIQQLVVDWNQTQAALPSARTILELFQSTVSQTPGAPAICYLGGEEPVTLTYELLDQQANQLAHHLKGWGVGPDVCVALHMERSVELLVSMWGVLKAGGAYVPLDPTYPADRLSSMLSDSQARLLITQTHVPSSLPVSGMPVICLDTEQEIIAQYPSNSPSVDVQPDNLAYLIYTSGSTGRPKGVAVSHRNLVHSTWARQLYYGEPVVRFLLLSSFNFDSSVVGLFWSLSSGGTLFITSEEQQRDPVQLAALIVGHHITHLLCLPALYGLLLQANTASQMNSLETVIVAGEACPLTLVQYHNANLPQAQLYNEYGPTEATVWSSVYACSAAGEWADAPLSIGRPITNTQLYILDEHGQLVPRGAVGELYVGGEGIVRGYHRQPAKTAEKFIPDPFGSQPGRRLYRTGDKVRYRADGNIEFLGRMDEQVKIRGFRIELTEVEGGLARHPDVQNAVVVVDKEQAEQSLLVGYVVASAGCSLSAPELRAFLQQSLPAYMIPSFFIILDELPRLPNGKIDRQALPSPRNGRPEGEAVFIPPETATEKMLAQIWEALLGMEKIGRHDNFFELGGHSLLAAQLVSRVRQKLQIEIPLKLVFSVPTLCDLAVSIETVQQPQNKSTAVTLIPQVSRQDPLPLSFGQRRLWFLDRLTEQKALYNLPILLHLRGTLNLSILEQSLNEVIRRHESLRTTFSLAINEPVQHIVPAVSVSIERLSWPTNGDIADGSAEIQKEAQRPFDLETGPLLRACLWQLSTAEHVLLITIHHIVADGWSVGVFQQELWAHYRARLNNEVPPAAPLPIQYADFALWQKAVLQGEKYAIQLDYWRRQLAGLPELNLPTDYARPAVPSFSGQTQLFQLSLELSQQLQKLAQTAEVSLFMTLMSAFQLLLARYTGQMDIGVGTPVANRQYIELEPLIGFFVNMLVMRTKLTPELTFYELVQRVKEITLDAYTHQDLPFELVVEALQPRRSVDRNPLCPVIFAWQNTPPELIQVSGLTVKPLVPEAGITRFDLELHMWPEDEVIQGIIIYNADLFMPETVQALAGHFHTLLQNIVSDPYQSISRLPLLTEQERQHILITRNNTTSTLRPTMVHQMVADQAAQRPQAAAIVSPPDMARLTYGQLDRQANQIAQQLRRLNVGPDIPVAVCLPRSAAAVAACLGILKAGGAYVPLDPAYPSQRLAYMLADLGRVSHPLILLTSTAIAETLPAVDGVHPLLIDTDWMQEPVSEDNPTVPLTADNLAYIIYTSGSTGQPKGVQLTHGGLLNLISWHQKTFAVSTSARATHLAGLGFDATVWEIWPYLTAGAVLYLVDEETRLSPSKLREWFLEQAITHSFVPTPLVAGLLAQPWPVTTPLRFLLTGGDRLLTSPSASLPFQLVNNYGPTEYTVVTTSGVVAATLPARQLPSIGRPISNTRLYVLDDHLQVVPAGVYGELYIGGLGVARGYLHQPGLTADRFIPDPFSGEYGSRLYRTGDVARYLPDGRLAFGGRRDHQVQVRGFRVEMGEIEAVLTNHPDIDQCVVLAKPTAAAGDSKLIAYLVPSPVLDKFETLIPMIRPYLAERLPAYMWPADYILVDTLPLTENGKVDHAALLNLESPHPTAQTRLMPDNHVERQIAAIWQEVLSKEQISSQDNFFDLGGHSLLLVQIQDQLEQNFGRSIPLTTLFNHPTIASLARYLRDEETEEIDPIDHQQISRRVAARQTAQQQRASRQPPRPFPVKKEA